MNEGVVPPKPSASSPKKEPKKTTPKKSKRELSDEILADEVVSLAAAKKPKDEPVKKEETPKKTPKKATPKKATPKKETPKKQPEAKKKALVLDSDEDKEIQPAKKAAKKSKQEDDDDGVVMIVSDEELPKKQASKPAVQVSKPAAQAPVPAKRKIESPAKSSAAAKSPEAKKAKPAVEASAAAAAPKKKFDPRKFADRPPPPMLGLKPVPVGEENCLFGMVFVITGTLESLERDEATKLIERLVTRLSLLSNNRILQICWGSHEECCEKVHSCAGGKRPWRIQGEEDRGAGDHCGERGPAVRDDSNASCKKDDGQIRGKEGQAGKGGCRRKRAAKGSGAGHPSCCSERGKRGEGNVDDQVC